MIVSATVKAYSSLAATYYLFAYNTTADSDTFWSLVGFFHAQLPSLSESGVMGYYYVEPSVASELDPAQRGKVSGLWIIPEKTVAQTNAIIKPVEAAISLSGWQDRVSIVGFGTEVPDFSSAWLANVPRETGLKTAGSPGPNCQFHYSEGSAQADNTSSLGPTRQSSRRSGRKRSGDCRWQQCGQPSVAHSLQPSQ